MNKNNEMLRYFQSKRILLTPKKLLNLQKSLTIAKLEGPLIETQTKQVSFFPKTDLAYDKSDNFCYCLLFFHLNL